MRINEGCQNALDIYGQHNYIRNQILNPYYYL